MNSFTYESLHNMPLRIGFFVMLPVLLFTGISLSYDIFKAVFPAHADNYDDGIIGLVMGVLIIICWLIALGFVILRFEFNKDFFYILYPFQFIGNRKKQKFAYTDLFKVQYYGKGYDINSPFKIILIFKNNIKHKLLMKDSNNDRLFLELVKSKNIPLDVFIRETP